MFWAMIGNGYKSDLIVCPQRMNKDGYIEMLEKNHVFAKYRKFLKVNGQKIAYGSNKIMPDHM